MTLLYDLGLDPQTLGFLALNLVLGTAVLAVVRALGGPLAGLDFKVEMAERDNPAFGIALAGTVLAVAIMMTAAVSGESADNLLDEALAILTYGLVGLLLMIAARLVFDRVSLPGFSLGQAIGRGNVAAGLMDAGNLVASALVVRAVMTWAGDDGLQALPSVLIGFVLSQLLLSLASYYRLFLYNRAHGTSLQAAVEGGNAALALRFSGYRIGVAFAITAASAFVPFAFSSIWIVFGLWSVAALGAMVLVSLLAVVTDKLMLPGIDLRHEVDDEGNIAVGAAQAAIMIGIGAMAAAIAA
ncbi:MAG: DUF350 domain-containing protein [Alphaproteobacteria bacterium]